ncbi:Metal-dependent hydrolase, endonuclease/exonuclease/phosphatase family [Andreprevotia lacus DSM 23236]|jgi:endonuclease/exonuclease/phosphatase family metal-dependent hydrolase|uniref:Metal-dependent hydrolase, endonuclease/exonuclease/phosphatase family n=1 Tax=Andreprevotia lacus DSM 23236 TaxID=1121001 RepID=A0A1W1XVQ4_9NEIS|nr:sphingomyelin phosphodiesterase [Andreprevotia lacus]SMC28070.1 Metal-dependent hydrolase, endonuclease/exonuclease/phosphatase family [Andreprevotia lacus DSM 23236]
MSKLLRLALLLLAFFAVTAHAETYIYVTNTTPNTVTLQTKQSGDATLTRGKSWDAEATSIPPYATRRVLWMNRNIGITNGKSFYFDTTVTGGGSTVTLRQKLTGTLVSSNIWQAARGSNFDDPWYGDRSIHNRDTTYNGLASVMSYRAQATSGYDDIYYVIHNKNAVEPASAQNQFKMLTYNVWATPPVSTNNCARLDELANNLAGYDAVALQEIFDNNCRAAFLTKVRSSFPYQSSLVDIPSNILMNGGTILISRWPILADDTIVFDQCTGTDCLANKGAKYVQVLKQGVVYHLSTTHAPSFDSDEARQMRRVAFGQIRTLLDSKRIPATETLLIAGDMNVNKYKFPDDYAQMQTILRARVPASTGYKNTFDADVNANATNPLSGGTVEYLDYIMVGNDNRQPLSAVNDVRILRTLREDLWSVRDLSDHFPVAGLFGF